LLEGEVIRFIMVFPESTSSVVMDRVK